MEKARWESVIGMICKIAATIWPPQAWVVVRASELLESGSGARFSQGMVRRSGGDVKRGRSVRPRWREM